MQDERVYGPVTMDELLAMRDEGLVGFDTLISQDRKSDWKMLSATELAEMQRTINKEEVE